MTILKLLVPIILATFLNATANTLWKMHFSEHPFSIQSISDVTTLFISAKIILGILCYFCSMLLFFYLLSNYQLSLVIPLTALTYIFNFIAAYLIFHEQISWSHLIGTTLIIIGIFVIAYLPKLSIN